MSSDAICSAISSTLGLKEIGPLPLKKEKISLPNFAVAYLTAAEDPEKDTVTVLLEKDASSMQCIVARDESMLDRIQEFLSAWKAVGMSGMSLSHRPSAVNSSTSDAPMGSQSNNQVQSKLPQGSAVIGKLPVKKTAFSGPLDLEKNGNLIGLNHPMFHKSNEPSPDPCFPDGLGDFADPLQGVKRPKHLPPNAIWEPARPDTRDPVGPRSGLPYI